jgi:MFS family permease
MAGVLNSSTKNYPLHLWLRRPVIWLVLASGLLTAFSGYLPAGHFFDSQASYLPLHTALEFFAITVGVLIFAVAWHTRDKHQDGRSLFIASLFLGVALLDFLHTLSFFGMPDFISVNSPGKAIVFWFAARLMAVAALLGAGLFAFERLRNQLWQWSLLVGVLILVCIVAWLQLFHSDIFPPFFITGKGLTDAKIFIEYLLVILCLLSALLMFHKSGHGSNRYWLYLGAALCLMMFSEFYFTLYTKVTDIYNLLGHVFKIIAYGLIYQAVFVRSVREPYVQLQVLQEKQEEISAQLMEAQRIAHLGQWELVFAGNKLTWSAGIFDLFEIDASKFKASY